MAAPSAIEAQRIRVSSAGHYICLKGADSGGDSERMVGHSSTAASLGLTLSTLEEIAPADPARAPMVFKIAFSADGNSTHTR